MITFLGIAKYSEEFLDVEGIMVVNWVLDQLANFHLAELLMHCNLSMEDRGTGVL